MPTIEVRINGIRTLKGRLGSLRDKLSDLSSFFQRRVRRRAIGHVRRAFETQGYGTWAALRPSTIRRKRAKGTLDRGILRDDLHYFRAATGRGRGNLNQVSPRRYRYGVDGDYFENRFGYNYPLAHEQGRGRLPRRPVFSLVANNEDFQRDVTTSARRYVAEVIREL